MAEMERSDIEDSFERSEKQMIRLYNLISLFQTNLSLYKLIKFTQILSIDLFSLRSNKGIPSKLKLFSSYQIFNLF